MRSKRKRDIATLQRTGSSGGVVDERLEPERLLDVMDARTRRICVWRLQGYTVREIAMQLKTTPKRVSTWYGRGVKRALRCIRERGMGSR